MPETEISDSTVSELFSRNPLKLTDQDITALVTKLRSQRARFVQGNKTAGTPAKKKSKATVAQEAALAVTGKLDLGDLGL